MLFASILNDIRYMEKELNLSMILVPTTYGCPFATQNAEHKACETKNHPSVSSMLINNTNQICCE